MPFQRDFFSPRSCSGERRLGSLVTTNTLPYRVTPPLGWWRGSAEVDSLSAHSACVEFCSPCKTIKKAAGSVHTAALIKIGKFKGFKGWKEEVTTLITLMFQICSNHQGLIQAGFFILSIHLLLLEFQIFSFSCVKRPSRVPAFSARPSSVCLFAVSAPT